MSNPRLPTSTDLQDTLRIFLPIGLANLGAIAVGLIDTMMIGRLGTEALAAAGLALSVYAFIFFVGNGVLFPVMVLVSHVRGANRSRTTPRIIRQGLWAAGMLSIPSLAILWDLENILLLAGQNADLARMAGDYMDYYRWAIAGIYFLRVRVRSHRHGTR